MEFMIPKDLQATVAWDPSREGEHVIIPTLTLTLTRNPVYTLVDVITLHPTPAIAANPKP